MSHPNATHYWTILDTSVVRETVRGNLELGIDLTELAALHEGAPISLSQTAYLELTNQLRRKKFTFEQWQAIALPLAAVLDAEIPIVPMGIALRVMLGVAKAPELDLERGLGGLRAMWHVLKTASTPADLREGRRVTFEGVAREFRPSAIKTELDEAERRWTANFERFVAEHGMPALPSDRSWIADWIRHSIGADDVGRIPELETAVQVALEFLLLYGKQYEAGRGYKPKLNDALDFDQLFALGLPAIICTSDGKLLRRVRALRTHGSDRVLTPCELLTRLRANRSSSAA